MFDRWKSPVIPSPGKGIPPLPPPRTHKKPVVSQSPAVLLQNGNGRKPYHQLIRTNSLPSPKKRNGDLDKTLNAWSEGLLAEFNSIIANELTTLLKEAEDDVFLSSEDEGHVTPKLYRGRMTRSKSLGHQTPSDPSSGSPSASDTSSSSNGSDIPFHRGQHYLRPDKGAPVLLRVTPLPDQDLLKSADTYDNRGHTPDEGLGCCDSEGSINNQVGRINYVLLQYIGDTFVARTHIEKS